MSGDDAPAAITCFPGLQNADETTEFTEVADDNGQIQKRTAATDGTDVPLVGPLDGPLEGSVAGPGFGQPKGQGQAHCLPETIVLLNRRREQPWRQHLRRLNRASEFAPVWTYR